jgi:acetate kinase
MNGLDCVVFTGGIGENDCSVRYDSCGDLKVLGIAIDKALNDTIHSKLQKISTASSKVEVWVVPTNEELLIARDTKELVEK